jgi:cytidylate kinase
VLAIIQKRDRIDSGRAVAPLRPAEDAILLNNDTMTVDEEVEQILRLCDC